MQHLFSMLNQKPDKKIYQIKKIINSKVKKSFKKLPALHDFRVKIGSFFFKKGIYKSEGISLNNAKLHRCIMGNGEFLHSESQKEK